MDCPNCNSQDIEIGESKITGKDFTAKVWYASCHATIGEDVNWGGGYDCEFFIVRERKEALLAEVQLCASNRLVKSNTLVRWADARMLKSLSKETITFVLLSEFSFSEQLIGEIVEAVWNSDNLLQEIQLRSTTLKCR